LLVPTRSQRYSHAMSELNMHIPVVDEEVAVDDRTRAAIDRGVQDADSGRTVSVDDVRKMIPKWLSKFASQKLFLDDPSRFGGTLRERSSRSS